VKDTPENHQLEEAKRLSLLWTGGFLAISLVMVQALISSAKVDSAEIVSVFAFAAAIPILAICALTIHFADEPSKIYGPRMGACVFVGASLASLGIAAALYHVSFVASFVFGGSALITVLVLHSPYWFSRRKESLP
jgi:cation transport ATPase